MCIRYCHTSPTVCVVLIIKNIMHKWDMIAMADSIYSRNKIPWIVIWTRVYDKIIEGCCLRLAVHCISRSSVYMSPYQSWSFITSPNSFRQHLYSITFHSKPHHLTLVYNSTQPPQGQSNKCGPFPSVYVRSPILTVKWHCSGHSVLLAITLYCLQLLCTVGNFALHHSMTSQYHHNHGKYVELFHQSTYLTSPIFNFNFFF